MNVEDNRGITKTTDTAVPDLERDVPLSHASTTSSKSSSPTAIGKLPARVTCGGNRLADTKPNWARTKPVMLAIAALVFASGIRNTP